MRQLRIAFDLIRETCIALVLHLRRTVFVIVGSALGIGMYIALVGLGQAGSAAVVVGLSDANGVTVTARAAGGAVDDELLSRLTDTSLPPIPGARATSLVLVGGNVLVSDALPSVAGTVAHEAVLLASTNDFHGEGAAWPATLNETVISHSLATRLGVDRVEPPYVIVLDGVLTNVVGTTDVPDTLGVSADVAFVQPSFVSNSLALANATHRLVVQAEQGQVDTVAAALPLVLSPNQPERIAILSSAPDLSVRTAVAEQTTSWMASMAWVGLLVAAVCVVLPLVIAIAERRPEIGLRRAMGIPTSLVTAQFTLEGMFSATAGGILGVGLGAVAQMLVCQINGWDAHVDVTMSVLAIVISTGLGLLAGATSAILASLVSPIEALKPGI